MLSTTDLSVVAAPRPHSIRVVAAERHSLDAGSGLATVTKILYVILYRAFLERPCHD
jgi:hypothetical protein